MAAEATADLLVKKSLFIAKPVQIEAMPVNIPMEKAVLDGAALLRAKIRGPEAEFGGIITEDKYGTFRFIEAGTNGVRFGLQFRKFSDELAGQIQSGNVTIRRDGEQVLHAVFVDGDLARKYQKLLNEIAGQGVKILIDQEPRSVLHTHQKNLPNRGDFSHVLWRHPHYPDIGIAEGVVTKDEAFFLVPSSQTPDLNEKWDKGEIVDPGTWGMNALDEEESAVLHIKSSSPEALDPVNAVRFVRLKQDCQEYSVALYNLKKGKNEAVRIF